MLIHSSLLRRLNDRISKIESSNVGYPNLANGTQVIKLSPVTTTGKSYTIPEDGWIRAYFVVAQTIWHYISVNCQRVFGDVMYGSNIHAMYNGMMPVKKGDIVKAWTGSSGAVADYSNVSIYFFPKL